jgi:hypothetical protein
LICYPFLIERHAAIVGQAWGWSLAYAAFTLLCAASAFHFQRHAHALPPEAHARQHLPESDWDPTLRDYLLWLTPAALGS